MRFWDGSALVPLVVAHATSSVTDAWLAADPLPAVWTLTPVEISSALAGVLCVLPRARVPGLVPLHRGCEGLTGQAACSASRVGCG